MLEQYDSIIRKASIQYVVPIPWIKAWILTESSGNPNAYRPEPKVNDASYGLMQLLTSTAKGLGFTGDSKDLYDPNINIDLGTKLIGQLRTKYGDDVEAVYSAYNSGSPVLYQTSKEVGSHVSNLVSNLQRVMSSEPLMVSMGVLAVGITSLAIWYWTRRGT